MDSACHVIGCHEIQETRAETAFDDVASTTHQSLPVCKMRPQVPWNKNATEPGQCPASSAVTVSSSSAAVQEGQ
jgi:hypothetical protein